MIMFGDALCGYVGRDSVGDGWLRGEVWIGLARFGLRIGHGLPRRYVASGSPHVGRTARVRSGRRDFLFQRAWKLTS